MSLNYEKFYDFNNKKSNYLVILQSLNYQLQ